MPEALFSIKPSFIIKILSGEKRYEFRKTKCKLLDSKIYLYATYPVCAIVGEVEVTDCITDIPINLWNRISHTEAGISKAEYFKYYSGKKIAYAYQLENPVIYKKRIILTELQIKRPPQSFYYLKQWQ